MGPAIAGRRELIAGAAVALSTLVAAFPSEGVADTADPRESTPWAADVQAVDRALARGDLRTAERAAFRAYSAAVGNRTWEGMADVGDAYRRLAEASPVAHRPRARAHESYIVALFRARQQGVLAGVIRIAEAFGALGDRDGVNMCVHTARGLAAQLADVKERQHAHATIERLAHRLFARQDSRLD